MTAEQRAITPRVVAQMIIFVVVIPFLPLLISRQWDWWAAWAYALIYIGALCSAAGWPPGDTRTCWRNGRALRRMKTPNRQKGLTGYREYAEQVSYRLLPGVW